MTLHHFRANHPNSIKIENNNDIFVLIDRF
jgi:hypothetical protein